MASNPTLASTMKYLTPIHHALSTAWPYFYSYILLPTAALLCLLILILAHYIHLQLRQIREMPKELPWIGTSTHHILPKLRASLATWKKGRDFLDEAWEKYTKHSQPCIVPSVHWPSIILPQSEVAWLVSQPDHVISNTSVQDEVLALEWLGHGPSLASVHDFSVIQRDLTRQIAATTAEVWGEVGYSCAVHFGGQGEVTGKGEEAGEGWYDVRLVRATTRSMLAIGNRSFVGKPTCRNRWYHRALMWWLIVFSVTALVQRAFMPRTLARMLMPVLRLPATVLRWNAARYLMPEIEKRVSVLRERETGGKDRRPSDPERKNDFMQWVIESAAARRNPAELDPTNLAHKLIFLNIFTVHTIQTTLTTILLTLLSQPTSPQIFATLRSEASSLLPQLPTNPLVTRKMTHFDSAIREVLRCEPMADEGLMREVVATAGVTTPSGLFLPRGTHVSVHTRQMQRRDDPGGDWDVFRAFRFSESNGAEERAGSGSAVQISDRFLSFGLGKHACPGRFFAVHVLKLMLGYLITHYDFEPLREKPKFIVIGSANVVSDETTIRVRKRRD